MACQHTTSAYISSPILEGTFHPSRRQQIPPIAILNHVAEPLNPPAVLLELGRQPLDHVPHPRNNRRPARGKLKRLGIRHAKRAHQVICHEHVRHQQLRGMVVVVHEGMKVVIRKRAVRPPQARMRRPR